MHDDTINRSQLKLNPISLPMRYVLVKDLLETAIVFRLNAFLSACSRFKKKTKYFQTNRIFSTAHFAL